MRHLVTLVAVLVASPAFASDRGGVKREPARTDAEVATPDPGRAVIRIDGFTVDDKRRRIDRADATIQVRRTEVVVAIALTLRGRDATPRAGELTVAIPPGATATGLELVAGDATGAGQPLAVTDARTIFAHEVQILRDPALLEYVGTAANETRLRLAVAPLTSAPVKVTVILRVPRAAASAVALHVDAPAALELIAEAGAADRLAIGGRARGRLVDGTYRARAGAGTRPIVVEYGASAGALWFTEAVETHQPVDPATSLLALLPAERQRWSGPTCTLSVSTPIYRFSRSTRDVRKVVRAHLPRVAHCYQLAVQRDPTQGGTLQSSWVIHSDGTVDRVTVDGAGDDGLRACVAGVLAGLTYVPDDGGDTLVHYPFVLAAPRTLAAPTEYPDLAADMAEYEAEQAEVAQAPR